MSHVWKKKWRDNYILPVWFALYLKPFWNLRAKVVYLSGKYSSHSQAVNLSLCKNVVYPQEIPVGLIAD